MKLIVALAAIGTVLLGACSTLTAELSPSAPAMSLHVGNQTALDVTVLVNGHVVGVFAPGGAGQPLDLASGLPPLPWQVEARSPSGRLLTTMTVPVPDTAPSQSNMHVIPMGRVDLSCGRLTLWAGDFAPSGPVPPSPAGSEGDCAP
jgi:hypothetical protein